ncbi:DUF1572 family protein [Paenibacillus mucilaginosus]|uniref:DUF1572 domain-containing protein n=2 Tax=Paenibacillus mucilaginosus TaxID=61624 RepID=H6N956_9BACL|nr:DUF1572 family protein [Paenibacillus mucilaginosus]AEI39551.1 hypothetical protein KNP414_00961 [Paenibacillus mucilaginosus KNP414]AFC27802.1 hypothetical protein PM3016_854 [Paenibacillus mucilaginosus 3016]MCG7214631.1 DUF1572 domain-containing protein [Paenibacillus mucilaginosus]WDM28508.1 DUF1572 family protein [Paenibacillus mucilaginosus]WFA16673.1 DUF1572 domain-containing protein [Paenibacillus mucilaginosus]
MGEAQELGKVMLEESIQAFRSMKALGDRTLAQLEDVQFGEALDPESNSMEVLIRHMHGNMVSRWTDFLTTDGEKPDRDRDGEFEGAGAGREELLALWEAGWAVVFGTLESLQPADLLRTVTIRGEAHTVVKAIQRQVSHYGYHVGQMVFLGKHLRSESWQTLSIARGQSRAFRPGT